MKDTWIGFLGVVLTTLAAFAFVYGEMGGIREQIGRVEGRLVGIEKGMTKIESRMTGIENRMVKVENRIGKLENRTARVEKWVGLTARGLNLLPQEGKSTQAPLP